MAKYYFAGALQMCQTIGGSVLLMGPTRLTSVMSTTTATPTTTTLVMLMVWLPRRIGSKRYKNILILFLLESLLS